MAGFISSTICFASSPPPPDGPNGVPTDKLVSDMRSLGLPALQMLAELSGSPGNGQAKFVRIQDRNYGAFVSHWRGTGDAAVNIGVVAPLDDFTCGKRVVPDPHVARDGCHSDRGNVAGRLVCAPVAPALQVLGASSQGALRRSPRRTATPSHDIAGES